MATNADRISPLTLQLKTKWDEAKADEKELCIEKASEACSLVCDVIAPKAGKEPFHSCFTPDKETNYGDLVPLMQSYSSATTRNVKTQILSLYAYRYPKDRDFQERCVHRHTLYCRQCDDIASCLEKMQQIVKDGCLNFYSTEQQADLLYDIEKASDAIVQWKAHIIRSVNQECAKQDILARLDQSSCLIVMDWAMKFLQLRYREKQSDWFAVTSILEDPKQLKVKNPALLRAYLQSDEAGCYHNSSLIAALTDIAKRVSVAVHSYHFSEPQSGKDICDRILCPIKSSIRTYCNEGNDILTAVDMRDALMQHPVKGTTAAVSVVNESKKTLFKNKIEHFGSFHNFEYEDSGVRVWKCYGIGNGKHIPYNAIYIKHQDNTVLQTTESQGFYDPPEKRQVKHPSEANKKIDSPTPLFECSVLGCAEAFKTFAQLEFHHSVGKHTVSRLNQYDAIRRDWALKFLSVGTSNNKNCYSDSRCPQTSPGDTTISSPLQTGWALSRPRSNVRFSQKAKEYLTARFTLGERTGRKADPAQVAADMRNAKDESNERLFTRTEWMTKTQVQSFFSRLAATRRKADKGVVGLSVEQEEDVQCLQEISDRQELTEMINREINLSHPICYGAYDLCERYDNNTFQEFNVALLKTICNHFEIPVKSRDKKKILIEKLSNMISECECVSHENAVL